MEKQQMKSGHILEEIASRTKERIEEEKRRLPCNELKARAAAMERHTGFPFEKALGKPGMSFICEVKKASPSKGVIAADFPWEEIGAEYERAGADAVSVLTEPYYFQGRDRYLTEIRSRIHIPVLRKDFTVDEYMIFRAKTIGADAVLLICAILTPLQLSEYLGLAEELGLSALTEVHDEAETETALAAGARVIGANNRNLKDFSVDMENSLRLRKKVPREILFVSESGIKTREHIKRLEEQAVNGVLIGETLMRAEDKTAMLKKLRGR